MTGSQTDGRLVVGGCTAHLVADNGLSYTEKRNHGAGLYVGLTGGIGSGKTTLAKALEQAGALVISADELAREVVEPGTPGFAEVVEFFGPDVLDDRGDLDRQALASMVFADAASRKKLESITHPRIAEKAAEFARRAPASSVAVYDVPLLIENQMAELFDLVIVVDAPLEHRLERLEARGVPRSDAMARVLAQATDQERLAASHVWVHNGGSEEDLAMLGALLMRLWLRPLAAT